MSRVWVIVDPSLTDDDSQIQAIKESEAVTGIEFAPFVRHTTRAIRPGEVDGVDFRFESIPDMFRSHLEGNFLEVHEPVRDEFYAMPKLPFMRLYKELEAYSKLQKVLLLKANTNGVDAIRKEIGSMLLNPYYAFIDIPDEEIRNRLAKRNPDISPEEIENHIREAQAKREWGRDQPAHIVKYFDGILPEAELTKQLLDYFLE